MIKSRVTLFVIVIATAVFTLAACSSSEDELEIGESAFLAAHQASDGLESYSAQFSTGFGPDTQFTASERMEYFAAGPVVSRLDDGSINVVVADNIVYRPLGGGRWCRRPEIPPLPADPLSMIPESLERVIAVEQMADGLIAVEGLSLDDAIPANAGRPVVMTHRFVIDTIDDRFITWTQWPGLDADPEYPATASLDELLEDLEMTKTGPWNRLDFSGFGKLEPVEIPDDVTVECADPR